MSEKKPLYRSMGREGKKKWLKPILTILTRGTQEEAVLARCKQDSPPLIAGPGSSNCWIPGWPESCAGTGPS